MLATVSAEALLSYGPSKNVSKSLLHMTIAHVYNEHIMHTRPQNLFKKSQVTKLSTK